MRYGFLAAVGLSVLLVGATCLPLFDLDPPQESGDARTLGVSVITPAEDHVVPTGDSVPIEWTAANLTGSSAVATVSVRARDDFADTILVGGLWISASEPSQSVDWDTTGFPGGEYSIHVEVQAGDLSEEATAPGRITLNTPPAFEFTEPTEDTELVEQDPSDPNDPNAVPTSPQVTIRWSTYDPDSDGTAQIRLDPDLDHESENEITIYEADIPQTSGFDSIDWDGRDDSGERVEPGRYNLFAVISDELNDEQFVEGLARISVPTEPTGAGLTVGKAFDAKLQGPHADPDSDEPDCFWGWGDLSCFDDPNQPMLADDWVANDPRPITRIRWWGSYRGWDDAAPPEDVLDGFYVGIWTHAEADEDDPDSFARPDALVWRQWVDPNDLTEEYVDCTYHPDVTEAGPDSTFRYTWPVPRSEWFVQDPNESDHYWLSISARYADADADCEWGWQTRATGDAVRITQVDSNGSPTLWAEFEQGELLRLPGSDGTWGLAFELEEAEVLEEDDEEEGVEFLTSEGSLGMWFTLQEDDDVFVDLRVDTDEDHENGNETTILSRYLVEEDTSDDSFDWDGNDSEGDPVDDGIYRVFMTVRREGGSSGTFEAEDLVFRRSAEEQPLIALLEPRQDVTITEGEGGEVVIEWRDDDPSESAKIQLVIDDDPTPAQAIEPDDGPAAEEVIASAGWDDLDPAGDGLEDTFTFYIGDDRPDGRYWIFAYIDRDQAAPWDCIVIAAGQIVVEDPDESN